MRIFRQFNSLTRQSLALALLGSATSLGLGAAPAQAEITHSAENGFTVTHTARVTTDPIATFEALRQPNEWWSDEHSWTGDASNFYMDAQAGGCFCELLPAVDESREGRLDGSVEHMRIIAVDRGRVLRLSGALGPLQSEAMSGTLTIVLRPEEDGTTTISFEYVVGGYMRFDAANLAPAVDGVIGVQLRRLANLLGRVETPDEADEASEDEADEGDDGAQNADQAEAGDADTTEEDAIEEDTTGGDATEEETADAEPPAPRARRGAALADAVASLSADEDEGDDVVLELLSEDDDVRAGTGANSADDGGQSPDDEGQSDDDGGKTGDDELDDSDK